MATYQELITQFPLKVITSEEEYQAAVNAVNQILDEREPNSDEDAYLQVLYVLIGRWESAQKIEIDNIWGVEALKVLKEENQISINKISKALGCTEWTVFSTTRDCVDKLIKLGELFGVAPSFFLPIK